MSDSAKRIEAQESRGFPPVGSAHRSPCGVEVAPQAAGWCGVTPQGERRRARKRFETLLQFKGFGGGVPLNTETAAVNPRVGSAS